MLSFARAATLAAALSFPAAAQFVTPPTNLTKSLGFGNLTVRWKEVPYGTCELAPGVKSYSGYVDVEPHQHLFFWFFEAREQDPSQADLSVWLNGGPGSSSMIGLFQENGPCTVNSTGDLVFNPYSWNNVSNMIYIDQPTQTGFSYNEAVPAFMSQAGDIVTLPNNTCPDYAANLSCGTYSFANVSQTANTTEGAAPNLWKALQGFMGAFPQYSRKQFNFATESYGGHYGPVFNNYIQKQNAAICNGTLKGYKEINLKTLTIGNGWYDPLIQYKAYYDFALNNTYGLKPYNDSTYQYIYNAYYGKGNCRDLTIDCNIRKIPEVCSNADNFCGNEIEDMWGNVANRDYYDLRELDPDPFPYENYVNYLNTASVQQAIGAYVNFTESSNTVGTAFGSTGDDDLEDNTIEDVRKLIKQGIYVVTYVGDADYICNWFGGREVADQFKAAGYSSAGYVNMSTSDMVVHGQVRQASNYAFVRIYESGHEVPFYQPLASLAFFSRAINHLDIATGKMNVTKGDGYKTDGPKESTFYNGNATVQFEVLPADAVYNTTTNEPDPYSNSTTTSMSGMMTSTTSSIASSSSATKAAI